MNPFGESVRQLSLAIAFALTALAQGSYGAQPGDGSAEPADAALLDARRLLVPVEHTAKAGLRDTFIERRGEAAHQALDIMAPRGTTVVATSDGRVAKLFTSAAGGLTVYQIDPDERFAFYYAHLDRYAAGLHEGMRVTRGQPLGYVGTTGNAPPDAPHLHFAIFRLGPERRWWQGTALNPLPFLHDAAEARDRQR